MATIKEPLVFLHHANLNEEATEILFEAGQEVAILKEWKDQYLCRNEEGLLFNIPKEAIDPGAS
jgi:hypothetical protein